MENNPAMTTDVTTPEQPKEPCTNHYSDGSKIFPNRDCCRETITFFRKYCPPFAVKGDNPPMVVAENGEALLSMMWPVHEQTPEGEQAAVEYVKGVAEQIASGLNEAPELMALLNSANANADSWQSRALTAEKERDEARQTAEAFSNLMMNCADTLRSRGISASVGPLDIRVIELAKRADRLLTERDALKREVEARWQPIETAPKDGTEILGFHPEWIYCEFSPRGVRSCIYDGELWHSSTWRDDDSDILNHCSGQAPLLWQPLPPPPQNLAA